MRRFGSFDELILNPRRDKFRMHVEEAFFVNCPDCREPILPSTTYCRSCGRRVVEVDDEITSAITKPMPSFSNDPPSFTAEPKPVVALADLVAGSKAQADSESSLHNGDGVAEESLPSSSTASGTTVVVDEETTSNRAGISAKGELMIHQLARTPEASTQELTEISSAMKNYVETENESAMKTLVHMMNNKPSLFARLFPTAYEKELEQITLDRLQTMYKAKKRFFELYTEVQLEIARKEGDALIATVGMDLQGKLTTFATDKIEEMSQTIGDSRQRFIKRITPQLQDLDNYKAFPEVYGPAHQSVKNEIKTYFEGIDELLRGFIEALKSRVSNSRT